MAAATTVRPSSDSGQDNPAEHRLRFVGYLHGRQATRLVREFSGVLEVPDQGACQSPCLWSCESGCCLAARACSNHRESRCAPCATRYRRRVGRLIESGATSFGRTKAGFVYLLTVNAPGNAGHQRWVPGKKGLHGVCGCEHARSEGDGVWNASASARWNLLRTRLGQEVEGLAYVRVVEVQKRGLLHMHVVVHSPVQLHAGRVQELALAAGFGCVMDLAPLDNPGKAARYLAKYVSKAVDQRGDVPWEREVVHLETGEVSVQHHPTYRAWSSSQNWGVRMADLLYAARRAVAIAAARRRELEAEMGPGAVDPDPTTACSLGPPG